MTVQDLIEKLFDEPLDAEVRCTPLVPTICSNGCCTTPAPSFETHGIDGVGNLISEDDKIVIIGFQESPVPFGIKSDVQEEWAEVVE